LLIILPIEQILAVLASFVFLVFFAFFVSDPSGLPALSAIGDRPAAEPKGAGVL
jgi:hypothetical protein